MIIWWSSEDNAFVVDVRGCPAAWHSGTRALKPSATPGEVMTLVADSKEDKS
jgi:hypothetical protein